VSLRRKTLLVTALTLCSLILVLFGSLRLIMLRSFEELEMDEARGDLERVRQSIYFEIDQLRRTSIDWGGWDETYRFVQGENSAFIKENLGDAGTFDYLELSLLAIADEHRNLLFAKELDAPGSALVDTHPSFAESLRADSPLTTYTPANNSNVHGLARLPARDGSLATMIVASQAVLPSNRQGESKGILIMGRLLDSQRAAEISQRTQLHIQILDLGNSLPERLTSVVARLAAGGGDAVIIESPNDSALHGYRLLYDLWGKPALLVVLDAPRLIYQEGVRALWLLGIALVGIGLGFGVMTLWLLERLVLARLTRLSGEVTAIEPGGLGERRVTTSGDDELTDLAKAVNRMLGLLDGAMRGLVDQQAKTERLLIDALPEKIAAELNEGGRLDDRDLALQDAVTRAQAAEKAKSDFLANISHEIRTPLNAILNLTGICLRDPLPERQRQRLEKVERSSSYLLALINEILDYSRIEAGQLELETLPFRTGELLTALEAHAAEAQERGLWFHGHLGAGVPPVVRGDPLRIQQVLRNLAANAVKFTERGGVEVWIRLIQNEGSRVWIEFSVRDSGIGIAADKLARIFDPFNQADSSTTRRYGGSGLGLAICHRLVRLMGGEIDVESDEGAGSLFRVRLPLQVASEEEIRESRRDPSFYYPAHRLGRLGGFRVLLVEDNVFNQAVAQELLEAAGMRVEAAADGKTAISLAEQGRYDLVLMDLQMPEMDGYETTRVIRALAGWADIPILALTASNLPETLGRCREAGMNDLIGKPISPAAFYDALSRWLVNDKPDQPSEALLQEPESSLSATLAEQLAQLASHPELRALFLQHHRGTAELIRQALADGEPDKARHFAHNLKSAAGTIGEHHLQALSTTVEVALASGDTVSVLPLLEEMAAELNRIGLAQR